MRTSTKILLARVEEFARVRIPAEGGGWAPVTPEQVSELAEILSQLIAAKYEPDADGDLPINFHLIDRTRFERTHFFPIPYTHGFKTPEEYEGPIDLALGNLKMAMDRFDILTRCRKLTAQQMKGKKP